MGWLGFVSILVLVVSGAINSLAGVAVGQVERIEEIRDDGVWHQTYRIALPPAGEPEPAFRWRLTVQPHKTIASNAASNYYRALAEGSPSSNWRDLEEASGLDLNALASLDTPIDELPLEELQPHLASLDQYIDSYIRRASRSRYCDWGLGEEDLIGAEALAFLLPEPHELRQVARLLTLRARVAIAEGRFVEAIDELLMSLRMAEHVSEQKFLISQLVAVAIVGFTNKRFLEWVSSPDSPNLYWALAELPRPIVDVREAIRLDMSLVRRFIPELGEVTTLQLSEDEWTKRYAQAFRRFRQAESAASWSQSAVDGATVAFAGLSTAVASYPHAKQRLIESGWDAEQVEGMPAGQVLLIDAAQESQKAADAMETVFYLPPTEAVKRSDQLERELDEMVSISSLGGTLAGIMLPAVFQIRAAQIRVEAQLNALQTIESLRNHLAEHGQFPDSLDELRLPAPRNPFTEDPFDYIGAQTTAVLEIPHIPRLNVFDTGFELRIADAD